jgi:hypothetical protein
MNTNQLDIVSALANPNTMSGQMPVEFYTNLWLSAFPNGSQKGKKYYKARLQELESWDNCNNKPNERAGKIAALKILINE